jgi:tRNA A-37 threonylcarbamoyl transferase component Bud32
MPADASLKTIAGRYELREEIGRGAMGVVWRAYDSRLRRDVALKEIDLPATVGSGERAGLEARVLREARAAARLNNPSAVMVFDVVEEDGRPWIVMELITSQTLDERVASGGPLDSASAARMGIGLVDALEAAHGAGIVHRDVKPANVMVDESGAAKLADFGIASLKDDPKITATGLVLGSPSYMAPEQAHSQSSGPAADMWSLGATLYFAVEGNPPFDKGAAIPTLTAVVEEEAPVPQRAGPLAPLIRALLAKDPSSRPDYATIRRTLEGIAAPPLRIERAPATVPAARLEPAPAAPSRRGQWLGVAAGIVVLASIVLLIVSQLASPDSDTEPRRAPQAVEPGGDGSAAPARQEVPVGWSTYEDATAGWSIAQPDGWEVIPASTDSTSVDFRDPVTHAYLRVDWTTTPGDSAVEAWRAQAASFAQRHTGYQEIGIEPTTFDGWPAATWEFTYSESGATLHAMDLGFVVRSEYGFALYFQTHEDDWDTSQPTFARFKRSFEAPS